MWNVRFQICLYTRAVFFINTYFSVNRHLQRILKKSQIFKTEGNTSFSSDKGYFLESSDIILDNKNKKIFSKKNSILRDVDENIINLDNFEYISDKSIFNSTGKIEIKDKKNNTYFFTQIIIDTKRREIIGTDVKAYLNNEQFKINKKNNPRIFANTAYIKEQQTKFQKKRGCGASHIPVLLSRLSADQPADEPAVALCTLSALRRSARKGFQRLGRTCAARYRQVAAGLRRIIR